MIEMPDGRWEADPAAFVAELNALPGDQLLAYLSEFPDDERKALINLLSKDAAKRYLRAYTRTIFTLGHYRWRRPKSRFFPRPPSRPAFVAWITIFILIGAATLGDFLGYF